MHCARKTPEEAEAAFFLCEMILDTLRGVENVDVLLCGLFFLLVSCGQKPLRGGEVRLCVCRCNSFSMLGGFRTRLMMRLKEKLQEQKKINNPFLTPS